MTQNETLDILKTGLNVFLTGPAGSGKTHVLRQYLTSLKNHGIPVGITASTGIAATHMNGMTIHAWLGIGIKDRLTRYDIEEILQRESLVKKIKNTRVLIIDEISMIHDYRLDMIDQVLKRIRSSNKPFGGLQIIVCGDFFQLPPINRQSIPLNFDNQQLFEDEITGNQTRFAYHSRAWKEANFIVCYLEEQYRQNDSRFLRILNAIREAKVTKDVIDLLRTRMIKDQSRVSSTVEPTRLYSHNANVDIENEKELARIGGRLFEYQMTGGGNKKIIEYMKKSCLAPEVLRLKIGARVMFVKNNYDKGYVNGTLGVVEDCGFQTIAVRTNKGRIVVEKEIWIAEDNDKILAEIEQYPLRLAWAITIHKSQGMSLDAADIDLSKSFEKGMGYVALSRVRSLEGLNLYGLNDIALQVHEQALEYDKKFREMSAKHRQEFIEVSKDKIKEMHDLFMGPELTPAEREEKFKKKHKAKKRRQTTKRSWW